MDDNFSPNGYGYDPAKHWEEAGDMQVFTCSSRSHPFVMHFNDRRGGYALTLGEVKAAIARLNALVAQFEGKPKMEGFVNLNGRRWRNKNTGTIYVEMMRGDLEAKSHIDMYRAQPVVIYRAENLDDVFVRPVAEFADGSFEEIVPAMPAERTVKIQHAEISLVEKSIGDAISRIDYLPGDPGLSAVRALLVKTLGLVVRALGRGETNAEARPKKPERKLVVYRFNLSPQNFYGKDLKVEVTERGDLDIHGVEMDSNISAAVFGRGTWEWFSFAGDLRKKVG